MAHFFRIDDTSPEDGVIHYRRFVPVIGTQLRSGPHSEELTFPFGRRELCRPFEGGRVLGVMTEAR